MAHRIVRTPEELEQAHRFLDTLKQPFTLETTPGADRTLDQNALQWLWATEVARQLGDRTASEVQREWKLRHGVPILREDSAAFRAKYDRHIRPLSYEQKIEWMDLIEVTSALKVRQMTAYLDTIHRECSEQGLRLTEPDAELAKYQARHRKAAA